MRIAILLLSLILSACIHQVKDIEKHYFPIALEQVSPFPTPQELEGKVKVLVKIKDQSGFKNEQFNTSLVAHATIENILNQMKNIQIVHPISHRKKPHTDYLLQIKIDTLTFTRKYRSRTWAKVSYAFARLGAILTVSAFSPGGWAAEDSYNPISGEYRYKGVLTGSISIVDAASQEKLAFLPLKKSIISRESVDEINLKNEAQVFNPELMRKTISRAIKAYKNDIAQNLPAAAHICGRVDDKHHHILFKATFGKADGISPGNKVILQRKVYEFNPLTNKESLFLEEIPLGKIVSNQLTDHFCWIKTTNYPLARTVKMGEKVIVKFKKL